METTSSWRTRVEKGIPLNYEREVPQVTYGAIVSKISATTDGKVKRGSSGLPDEEAEGEDDDDEDIDRLDEGSASCRCMSDDNDAVMPLCLE